MGLVVRVLGERVRRRRDEVEDERRCSCDCCERCPAPGEKERRPGEEQRVEIDQVPLCDHDRERGREVGGLDRGVEAERRDRGQGEGDEGLPARVVRLPAWPDERGEPGDQRQHADPDRERAGRPQPVLEHPVLEEARRDVPGVRAPAEHARRRRRRLPTASTAAPSQSPALQVARQRRSRSPRQACAPRTSASTGEEHGELRADEHPGEARCRREPDRPPRRRDPGTGDQEESERRDGVGERLLDQERRVRERRRRGGRDRGEERIGPGDDEPGERVGGEDHGRHQQHAEQLHGGRRPSRPDRATRRAPRGTRRARCPERARRRAVPRVPSRRSSGRSA